MSFTPAALAASTTTLCWATRAGPGMMLEEMSRSLSTPVSAVGVGCA